MLDSLCINPMNVRRALVFNSVTITGVQPNPNNGSFTAHLRVSNDEAFDIELVSLQGERIWKRTIAPAPLPSSRTMDIAIDTDVAPGAYMLSVRTGAAASFHAVMISQ
jgi:hypothetical protein